MRWITRAAPLCALAVMAFHCDASAQTKQKLSIVHLATANTPVVANTIVPFKEKLEATGLAEVTLYGTGTAYASNPSRFTELAEKGLVDMVWGNHQLEPARYPLNLLIAEPFAVANTVEAAKAYMFLTRNNQALLKEYGPDLHVMWVSLSSPFQVHARKPVKTIEDLNGMRIFNPDVNLAPILREVGASPVALPSPAQYENLQKGVVDATITSWVSTGAFGFLEVTSDHYELNWVAPPMFFAINRSVYEKLHPKLRKVVDEFSGESAARQVAIVFQKIGDEQREKAIQLKHQVLSPSQSDRDALRIRFNHIAESRANELEKRSLPAKQVREDIRRALAGEN